MQSNSTVMVVGEGEVRRLYKKLSGCSKIVCEGGELVGDGDHVADARRNCNVRCLAAAENCIMGLQLLLFLEEGTCSSWQEQLWRSTPRRSEGSLRQRGEARAGGRRVSGTIQQARLHL